MPLNPNGTIDKPALPFPDTAQVAPAGAPTGPAASPTEEAIRAIWARVLPSPPSPIPLDESFFDVGGHSILATRLIFEIRKAFLVDAPLGLIFEKPTIAELAAAVDELRSVELGFEHADGDQSESSGTLTIEAVREQTGNVRTDSRYDAIASLPRIPLPKVCHGFPEFEPENVRF